MFPLGPNQPDSLSRFKFAQKHSWEMVPISPISKQCFFVWPFPPRNIFATLVRRDRFKLFGLVAHLESLWLA